MGDKKKLTYVCGICGYESAKWYGQCPRCNEWNTLEEVAVVKQAEKTIKRDSPRNSLQDNASVSVNEIDFTDENRISTGLSELDRVFGGGLVSGSVTLIGGDPGIGKSTLLLQICEKLGETADILYVSGEESLRQLKLRARRLHVESGRLRLLTKTEIDSIVSVIDQEKPEIVIIDSVQTMYSEEIGSIPGSITQLKECALRLTDLAKAKDISVFLVGHINKEGAIAGPKVLEHMVDVVLYFEGDKNLNYRILRAAKNRYGSTNEIGIFEMSGEGLVEVENPSVMLLSGKPNNVSGTCTVALMEGSRPILAEVQALLVQTSYGMPRRTASGIDHNRVSMLLAVLEKRAGLKISNCDVFVNVIGGLRLTEPSSDLAVSLSMASSFLDKPIDDKMVSIGEVGLAGEIRTVNGLENRISEAKRLGFNKFIVPYHNKLSDTFLKEESVIRVKNIAEAIEASL